MKRLLVFVFALVLLGSCKKNSDANSEQGYSGSYTGTVIDSMNGTYHSTLNNHTIIIVPTQTQGVVSLTNGLLMTNTGNISGNTFQIPQTIAAENGFMKVIESADGTFGGPDNNTWTVTFYQDQVDTATNNVFATLSRSCVLIKQ
tara:strand:+ start:18 stop:452 length:435 start_codon:yes stop_codon:yes gene_type:complete